MLLTVLSWGWIGLASFLCGFAVLQTIFPRKVQKYWELDCYVLSGLCALTVYAQTFSLFYKVGALATGILGVVCLLIVFRMRSSLLDYFRMLKTLVRPYRIVAVMIVAVFTLILTVQYAAQYDTGLYHAQSIRWIEEYGVVKGLGNLHNRLAYNSAFFCLQALFSMKFLVQQSLSTMNGFIALLMLSYAVTTQHVFRGQKTRTSDLFKIGLIIYLGLQETRYFISSPGSDILALSMVLYLCAKWCEKLEADYEDELEYGVLCLLAVWTITVKLSGAMLLLLAIYPAVQLMRNRRWKLMGLLIGAGILIAAPFLARNVVVSGYLLYPYASIDVFDVDWKMAESVVQNDSQEITAWGREMKTHEQYDAPMTVWLPVWYRSLQIGYRLLLWWNLICVIPVAGYVIWSVSKRRHARELNLLLFAAAGMLMWFFLSPLIRYGGVYLLLLPFFLLGQLLDRQKSRKPGTVCISIFMAYSFCFLAGFMAQCDAPPIKRPLGYMYGNVTEVEWEGITMYLASGSDCVGYHYFPSTPNQTRLDRVELRTGRLEDGFRLKQEYKDLNMWTSGDIQ